MLRIWSPHVRRHVIARETLFFPLVLYLVYVRVKRRQLLRADQYLLLSGRRIHVIQFALLSLFVALHKRKPGPIRTPLRCLWTASRQAPWLKQGVDGQRLGRRSLRRNLTNRKAKQRAENKAGTRASLSFHEATSQERVITGERKVYTA